MANMVGANPDDLDSAAERLRRSADKMTSIHAETLRLITASPWTGTDADRFASSWRQRGRSSLEGAAALLRDASDTLKRNADDQRRTSDGAGGAVGLRGATVPTSCPVIPPAPDKPGHDPGAGEHGSDPWYTRGDDKVFHGVAATAATAADALGYTNAARHLRHYLNNSGDDLRVDPDVIARDVPGFKAHTENQAQEAADAKAAQAIAAGQYGEPVPFSTGWDGYYVTEGESKDWFYGMGGLSTSATGYVIVHEGHPPRVEVSYQTHVYDRYNWDEGKQVTIGGVTITDHQMGELHRAGQAQEYDVTGSSGTHTYTRSGADGPVTDSSTPDPGRDGERSDPTRDQQPGRSRTAPDGSLR